jgi:hypothetical protein
MLIAGLGPSNNGTEQRKIRTAQSGIVPLLQEGLRMYLETIECTQISYICILHLRAKCPCLNM